AIVSYGLGFLALSGCASAPGYRSSAVQPPASFREVTEAASPTDGPHPLTPSPVGRGGTQDGPAVSTDYWDQLGDTTLSRLVGEVQRANLDVRAAGARASAARPERVRSASERQPEAPLAGRYAREPPGGAWQFVRPRAGPSPAQLHAGLDTRPGGAGGGGPVPHRYARRPLTERGRPGARASEAAPAPS